MCALPHGTNRLPLDWFSWNLVLKYFSKICRENSSFFKIWHNNGHFTWRPIFDHISFSYSYNEICLRQCCRENQNTHCMASNFFPRKSYRLCKNVKTFGKARQVTNDNIIRRMRFGCWIAKATETHAEYVILIAFLRQQWLRETLPTRGKGSRYKLPGLATPEGGPGPSYVAYVCVFRGNIVICRSYELPLSDHTQVTLQLGVSLSDLVRHFYPVCLCWLARIFSLPRDLSPLSAALRECNSLLHLYVHTLRVCFNLTLSR